MKHLPYSIPLPRRAGVYEYLNITRLGTLKIESPPGGTTIEKDTTGAPGTFSSIMAYPADWLDGETIRITKTTGMSTVDCYKPDELFTSTDVATTMAAGLMAAADKTKLDGIATAATANDTDVNLKNRSNHTGSQAISTVTGLTAALSDKVETSLLGANSGVATLDGTGKLTPAQAPAGMGTGDMTKSMYDTDNDGIVDAAESVPWSGVTGKPSVFTPDTHSHAQSDVTGLVTALSNKVETSLLGANSGVATLDVTGKVPTAQLPAMGGGTGDMTKAVYDTDNDGVVDAAASVPWSGVTSKPSVFTPDTHTHIIADVTGLQTALDGKAGALTRTTYSKTTASLANLATESGSIPVGKTISILYITLDRAARVRFYATAAIRDADVGRSIMTEPVDGCFYDVQSGGAATYFGNTGAILVYNGDTSAVSNIYYTVTNVSGSTSTVNFILGHLVMEV